MSQGIVRSIVRHYRPGWREGLYWWLVWTALAIVMARIETADAARAGFAGATWEPWCWAFSAAYAYALVTPIVVAFCHRWPLQRGYFRSTIPRLLGLYVPVALLAVTLMLVIRHAVYRLVIASWYPIDDVLDRYIFEFPRSLIPYIAVVFVTYARIHQRRADVEALRAARLDAELSQAQLATLQGQLQPHFLFNTLHLISSKVYQSPAIADSLIANLADLLRYSLRHQNQSTVALREEIEAAKLLLTIARLRFGERFDFDLDIEPATLVIPVPTLILQPLLDNALKHGIEPRREGGRLRVAARARSQRVVLEVESPGSLKPGKDPGRSFGIGLENTRRRLHALYAERAQLSLKQTDAGVIARLSLPIARSAHETS